MAYRVPDALRKKAAAPVDQGERLRRFRWVVDQIESQNDIWEANIAFEGLRSFINFLHESLWRPRRITDLIRLQGDPDPAPADLVALADFIDFLRDSVESLAKMTTCSSCGYGHKTFDEIWHATGQVLALIEEKTGGCDLGSSSLFAYDPYSREVDGAKTKAIRAHKGDIAPERLQMLRRVVGRIKKRPLALQSTDEFGDLALYLNFLKECLPRLHSMTPLLRLQGDPDPAPADLVDLADFIDSLAEVRVGPGQRRAIEILGELRETACQIADLLDDQAAACRKHDPALAGTPFGDEADQAGE